jgi:hypothetical protein
MKVWERFPISWEPLIKVWERFPISWKPLIKVWERFPISWEPLIEVWESFLRPANSLPDVSKVVPKLGNRSVYPQSGGADERNRSSGSQRRAAASENPVPTLKSLAAIHEKSVANTIDPEGNREIRFPNTTGRTASSNNSNSATIRMPYSFSVSEFQIFSIWFETPAVLSTPAPNQIRPSTAGAAGRLRSQSAEPAWRNIARR